MECRVPLPSTPDAFDIYSPVAPTPVPPTTTATTTRTTTRTTTTSTQYIKLIGSIKTVFSFSIDLIDSESDLFKGYASTLESEMSSIIMRSSIMESVDLRVIGFSEVSAARKRRQATTITTTLIPVAITTITTPATTKAMAVFEALAEITEDAILEDVEGAVENEIKSATVEELGSLDADSFDIIGAVVGTITSVPMTCPKTIPTTCQTTVPTTCPVCSTDCEIQRVEPSWSSWEDANACQPDGTRIRTRDCEKNGADSNECSGESSEIIDCTPKECINIACDCDFESDTFGKKNGVCSGKNFFISNRALRWFITILITSRSQFGKYH